VVVVVGAGLGGTYTVVGVVFVDPPPPECCVVGGDVGGTTTGPPLGDVTG